MIPAQPLTTIGCLEERRKDAIIAFTATLFPDPSFIINIDDFSIFRRLVKVLTHVFCFVRTFRKIEATNQQNSDRASAVRFLIRQEQKKFFSDTLCTLLGGKQLAAQHPLVRLYPFVDDGILKVGGRLAFGEHLSEGMRYPVILPKASRLSALLVTDVHHRFLHAGTQVCITQLRRQFWICGIKSLARQVIRSCVTCARFNSRPVNPLMADLPKERIIPSPLSLIVV